MDSHVTAQKQNLPESKGKENKRPGERAEVGVGALSRVLVVGHSHCGRTFVGPFSDCDQSWTTLQCPKSAIKDLKAKKKTKWEAGGLPGWVPPRGSTSLPDPQPPGRAGHRPPGVVPRLSLPRRSSPETDATEGTRVPTCSSASPVLGTSGAPPSAPLFPECSGIDPSRLCFSLMEERGGLHPSELKGGSPALHFW